MCNCGRPPLEEDPGQYLIDQSTAAISKVYAEKTFEVADALGVCAGSVLAAYALGMLSFALETALRLDQKEVAERIISEKFHDHLTRR